MLIKFRSEFLVSDIVAEMPSNVIPLRQFKIELKTIDKIVTEKRYRNLLNITAIGALEE